MAFDPQQRRQALQAFMTEYGLRIAPWEAASNLGDGTLRKFMDDKTGEKTLTDKTYGKLAVGAQRKLGRSVSIAELQGASPPPGGLIHQPSLFVESPARPSEQPRMPPPPSLLDKPDIPVWASAAAGDGDGAVIYINDEPIDYIRRSERTAAVKDPWAFHVIGESMLERLAQGDQIIVSPALPLLPSTDCVFVHQSEDGNLYALVKRLLRANSDVWRVRQLNPAKDFDLSRKKWTKAYRIAEIRPRM